MRTLATIVRCAVFLLPACLCALHAGARQPVAVPDGFAALNGGTTGGGEAQPVFVSTAEDFRSRAQGDDPAVIVVQGRLEVGAMAIGSNKTIIGADTRAGLYGGALRVGGRNCIFQNLTFGPADGDTFEITGGVNIFVHKCEFLDSTDELCSIVRQADLVTVSWCHFHFTSPDNHSYAHLIGNKDSATDDRGKLRVTLHHNWYDNGVRGRMPRVRFGQVHIYNHYYNSDHADYGVGVGKECRIRIENSWFENMDDAWDDYGGVKNGEIGWAGLKFSGCAQPTFVRNAFPVFKPPYAYAMDEVNDVPGLLTDPTYGAGNRLTRTTKIEDSPNGPQEDGHDSL